MQIARSANNYLLFETIMKIEYQDRIEDYLLDRMSDDERLVFEKELEKDDELRDQFEFTSTVKTALMLENIENDISNWKEARKMRETVAVASNPKRHLLYWISGIAAVLIVGFIIFDVYQPSPQGMSSTEEADTETEVLLSQGEFLLALAQIEKEEAHIRSELMLIEREMGSRGRGMDDAGDNNRLTSKLEHLLFLKAQAFIGLNRKEEAVVLLDEIRHSESIYKVQADSLYNVLKE